MGLYSCATCGKSFVSYNPSPRFCSQACRTESLVAPVDIERMRNMYESGLTQREIAKALGVTQKAVFGAMKRHGIKARVAAKRDQTGEKNTRWAGDGVGRKGAHSRLYRKFGQPKKCEVCGTEDPRLRYDWANLTGRYEDENDYKRMCRSCHWKYDEKHLNFKNEGSDGHAP